MKLDKYSPAIHTPDYLLYGYDVSTWKMVWVLFCSVTSNEVDKQVSMCIYEVDKQVSMCIYIECMYIYICVCIYLYACIYIYIYIYIYICYSLLII